MMHNLVKGFQWRSARKRRAAGKQVIQNRAERIYIAGPAYDTTSAIGLLGWHEPGSSHNLAAQCQLTIFMNEFGQSEVGNPRLVVLVNKDVGRL